MRTAKEVLDDHLKLSKSGNVEEDLSRNYSKDVVILTTYGKYSGHEDIRQLAKLLQEQLPGMNFDYKNFLVEGEVGFLEWSASSKNAIVKDGADSYTVRLLRKPFLIPSYKKVVAN